MLAALAALTALLAGCATDPLSGQRLARYRPDINAADREFPVFSGDEGRRPSADQNAATNLNAETPAVVASKPTGTRRLKRGDLVEIYLRGILRPQDIKEEIDGNGNVNLPLIGTVHLEGLTTSDAENLIEKAYIEGRYYRQITVIVVAQADEYFMRGEIKDPGRYELKGDISLLMAIARAGGYTDWANPKKIAVYRGDKVLRYNAVRIEAGKDEDPLIEPGDIIVVRRRWI